MSLSSLNNLVKAGQLKKELADKDELQGLLQSGRARLKDSLNEFLAEESRFDLAYNAAHSLALAALRFHGYRAANRYVVFQVLPTTLSVGPEVWRVLSKCHDKRNLAEYEGHFEMDVRLLKELVIAAQILLDKVETLIK